MERSSRKGLRFEALECRRLLAVLRVGAWNTLNGPNDAVADADFATVLAAIGNETVAGNTRPIDILALQETDLSGSGSDSIGRLEGVLDGLYPATDYASLASSLDGGGDATGFVYDTSTVTLLNAIEIAPELLTHTILRGEFRPQGTVGESDFYVYSVHLRSGSSAADEAVRGIEAGLLREDIDLLGEGAAVLFVGDLNLQGSNESAFANLAASGTGQLQDVAGALGDWSDSIEFLSLHSQNPRDNLNDRFDLHLASGELFDGVGLEYVENSFHVFGNNGTHTLNSPITTGTGAAPEVLTALVAASDHLPVIADYEIIASVPQVRITETGSGTEVAEGGSLYDTYQVVLDTVPTATVTVTVMPDAQLDLGFTTQLVFTPENAFTPQTIVVNAWDDLLGEGNHSGLVTHTVASLDADYDGISTADVAVSIRDNDAPTLVINELDSDTPSFDSLEFVELFDGGVGNTSLTGKTVVFFNGNTDTANAVFDLTGQTTDSDGFFVLGNAAVAAADLVFSNGALQNGPDAVALFDGPFAAGGSVTTANLLDAVVYDTDDPDDPGLLVLLEPGQSQINEDENNNQALESLARLPDHGLPRQTSSFAAVAPTPGALNAPPDAGVLFLQSGSRIDVAEGGFTDSYQLALDTIPAATVTIQVTPDAQTDLGAGPGVAIALTFTPADALIPQVVTVTAVDDDALEGEHTTVITHTVVSADLAYDQLTIGNIVGNIIDNEMTVPPSLVISEIMFNPDSDEAEPGIAEWIEIVNTGTQAVDLGGWRFDDEDATDWGVIPQGTTLVPSQVAVFFDEDFTDEASFRSAWSVPSTALVIGLAWGNLANSPSDTNEILELLDNENELQDLVNFDDANGWPSDTPDGASITLLDLQADNNLGSNWARSVAGVDGAVVPSGPLFSQEDVGSPGRVAASADFNSDGDVDGSDFLIWQRGLGLPGASSSEGDANQDQLVDGLDLAIWTQAFGDGAALSGQLAVASSTVTSPTVTDAPAIDALTVIDLGPVQLAEVQSLGLQLQPNADAQDQPTASIHVAAADQFFSALAETEVESITSAAEERLQRAFATSDEHLPAAATADELAESLLAIDWLL